MDMPENKVDLKNKKKEIDNESMPTKEELNDDDKKVDNTHIGAT